MLRRLGIGVIGVAFAATGLAACSGSVSQPAPQAGPTAAEGATDRAANFLFGRTANRTAAPATDPARTTYYASDCPSIDVRQGASTFTVYGKGDPSPTNVKYQATVGETARECDFSPSGVTMKIGMQGRIIIGPVGAPGKMDIPIRIAIVQEGPQPKTVWTKLYKTSVPVPGGQPSVTFTHVENNVQFPNPGKDGLEAYVVYLGFDNGPAKRTPAGIVPLPGADPGAPVDQPRRSRRSRRANPS